MTDKTVELRELSDKPLPCPFCGNDDIALSLNCRPAWPNTKDYDLAYCPQCSAQLTDDGDCNVVAKWNRRVERPSQPAVPEEWLEDESEVLFALQMACQHDIHHQAKALRTWLPRIEKWYRIAAPAPTPIRESEQK